MQFYTNDNFMNKTLNREHNADKIHYYKIRTTQFIYVNSWCQLSLKRKNPETVCQVIQ